MLIYIARLKSGFSHTREFPTNHHSIISLSGRPNSSFFNKTRSKGIAMRNKSHQHMASLIVIAGAWLAQSTAPVMANNTSIISQSSASPDETVNKIAYLPKNIDLFKELESSRSATVTFNPEQDYDHISILFSEIALPENAYLQIIPSSTDGPITYNYPEFYNRKGSKDFESDPVSAKGVSVRLVYPEKYKSLKNGKVNIIGYRLTKDSSENWARNTTRSRVSRAVIDLNQMKEAICYQELNPNFYQRSLAVAKINNGSANGSGWNIAGVGPYVMTNHHVAGGVGPKKHSLIYNFQSPTCDPVADSVNRLTIKTEAVVASGGENGFNDWSIYKVDELAWREAGIVPFFGNLWMDTIPSTSSQLVNLPLFIPQHPRGREKKITHLHDDGAPCSVTGAFSNNQGQIAGVKYNCDTAPGSSGSPVLSQKSYGVIAEHSSGGTSNHGVSIKRIYDRIASLTPDANKPDKAVVGKGKIIVSNATVVSHMSAEVPLDLHQSVDLKALDDTRLINYGNYYLFKARGRGSDGKVKSLNARLSIQQSAKGSAAAQKLVISFLQDDNIGMLPELASGWMAFYLNDYNGGTNLANLIVPFTWEGYDPFMSPFPAHTKVEEYTVTARQPAISHQIQLNAGDFGFTTLRTGQGPMSLAAGTTGFSAISVQVKDEVGQIQIMKLRGQRKVTCSRDLREMNDYTGCASGDRRANLVVSYLHDDNPDLPKGHRYQGILPVQAQRDVSSVPLLVNIDVEI